MNAPLQNPPYGLDTSCTDFMRPGVVVSGVLLLAEACYRRLTTTRGQLEDDPNYGFCVTDLLQRPLNAAEIAQIGPQIEAELLHDERLDDVQVTVTTVYVGVSLELDIAVTGTGAADGSAFTLALHVTDVTTTLIDMQETST